MLYEVSGNGLLQTVNYNFDQLAGPQAGTNFYVDGNAGDDTEDGLSWGTAFKTLAVGLAVSHANIALNAWGWAARNRIYCKGDALTEDLVLLAQKTDIIGVGSYNQWFGCGLIGNHVPISSTGIGVRFYNMYFRAPAGGGDIFTLNSTQRGIEFHNCFFDATNTANASAAIVTAAVWFLKVMDCHFVGAFSDSVIEIGAGNAQGLEILRNYIESADNGIELSASATSSPNKMMIAENKIVSTEIGVNDLSGLAYIVNNRVVTLNAKGTAGAGAIVGGAYRMLGNLFSASNVANCIQPANGAI